MLGAMAAKPIADFYEEGIVLFNAGRFFECHDAWEEVWKRSRGAEKLFYQGMIQAAVAILHAERGNTEGARSLYEKAQVKLDGFPAEHKGIALEEFRIALREFFSAVLDSRKSGLTPPRLRRVNNLR